MQSTKLCGQESQRCLFNRQKPGKASYVRRGAISSSCKHAGLSGSSLSSGSRETRPVSGTKIINRRSRSTQSATCFMGTQQTTQSTTIAGKQKLHLSWAGAGVFFFWQLGAMKYLAERYDLTKVPMVGASGGSLASVLAGCGVDADRVIELAFQLSVEHNIWERSLGLLGVWGGLIEQWLDTLLPDNAHEMCRNRITVVVTTIPDWKQIGITDFKDKKDLMNACMASSHVPFFLDFKLSRTCRGKQCVDGSFPDFFTGVNCDLLQKPNGSVAAVVFDYFDDRNLKRNGRMDMLELKSYDEVRKMYQLGYDYAAKLHADGKFDHYELAEVLLQGQNGHMSEVLVPEHSHDTSSESVSYALEAAAAAARQQQQQDMITSFATAEDSGEEDLLLHEAAQQQYSPVLQAAMQKDAELVVAQQAQHAADALAHGHHVPGEVVVELQQDEAEIVKEISRTTTKV